MEGSLGGIDGDLGVATTYVRDVDGGPPRRHYQRPGSAHHLTLRCCVADPQGGTVGDSGSPTTYVKDVDGEPPGRHCRRLESAHHPCQRHQ
jgi:hypothetical protein